MQEPDTTEFDLPRKDLAAAVAKGAVFGLLIGIAACLFILKVIS